MAPEDLSVARSERQRISAALIELLAQHRYNSIGLDHLTRSAGVEVALFERHFDGLDDCFAAVWSEVDAELVRRVAEAYERPGEWPDRLREVMRAGLRFLAEDEGRARLYVAEALYVNDHLRESQRATLDRLSALVDRGREGSRGSEGPPPYISEAIVGAIWHRVHYLIRAGRVAELPAELPRFMYFAVLPYRGAAAADAELGRPPR